MRRTLPDAALLAAALALPAAASAAVSPPPPTGPAPVGYQRLTLTDDSRPERVVPGGGPRRVVVRTWYPAARPGAAPAATLTDAEQGAWEGFAGLAPGALDGLGSDAT